MEEHVQKIRAAVDARKGRDFFIVARTDARQVDGLKEAIRRCKAYKKAGADALFIEAPRSARELAQIAQELEPPLVANMLEGGVTPLQSRDKLKRLGFHLVVYPLTCLYANARAMTEVLTHLRKTGTTQDIQSQLHTFNHFHDLIDLDSYYALDKKYSV
jgi:methylisocitrate lyase